MRTLSRHAVSFAALAILCPAIAAGAPPQEQQNPQQRIRVAVEVVAVDVQVIDQLGKPVPDLGPEMFTVTINGKRRRVVSAEQIRSDSANAAEEGSGGDPQANVPGRVIMLAIDCISFDATASRDVIQSVGEFIQGLQPDDYIGLSAYPNGVQVAPTRDHAAVLRGLRTVVGQRDGPGMSQFNLRPSEIIDVSRDISRGSGPALDQVFERECGQDEAAGPTCRFRLLTEVTNTALYYEGQATASLGMLRTLIGQMRTYPGRKTLLLVSGGMIASDVPGGRPDLGSLGMYVGREAAAANTAIYTLHIDTTLHDRFAAQTRLGTRSSGNLDRDSAVVARWLEQFSGAAGGALFTVQVGNAQAALERIRTELSSYYLLGVEPSDEDRDGRVHEVSVKIRKPNVTIRGRRWVMIPKRGAAAPTAAAAPVPSAAPPPVDTTAEPIVVSAEPPARAPLPGEVAALVDVFNDGDAGAFEKALNSASDLSTVIRGFRLADSPWPNDRKRPAVFALDLAVAALRSGARDVRDEGGSLLAEYHARIRAPGGADDFECWWFVAEAAALEGLFSPETALSFIPRGLQRCPSSARLRLAYAVVSEQQWLRGTATAVGDAEIIRRYEEALKFPETEAEARVRLARFLGGIGEHDRAQAALAGITTAPPEAEIRYFAHMVQGELHRARGRMAEARAAYEAALNAWPRAQSAQVALMTLLTLQGERGEAAVLSESVQTAPADRFDPWWVFWLGDYPRYPAIMAKLRELVR